MLRILTGIESGLTRSAIKDLTVHLKWVPIPHKIKQPEYRHHAGLSTMKSMIIKSPSRTSMAHTLGRRQSLARGGITRAANDSGFETSRKNWDRVSSLSLAAAEEWIDPSASIGCLSNDITGAVEDICTSVRHLDSVEYSLANEGVYGFLQLVIANKNLGVQQIFNVGNLIQQPHGGV